MKMFGAIKKKRQQPVQKNAAEAYDLWAGSYDNQPDNLMLRLDTAIFKRLLDRIDLKGRTVLDIGCGTGRHWSGIFLREPAQLTGYDVSAGMLARLQEKFPRALVLHATGDELSTIPAGSVDVVISTLTIAHLPNLVYALDQWQRVLAPGGDLLLTDFHPALLAAGGRRDFHAGKKHITISNYIHPVDAIIRVAEAHGLQTANLEEITIDESLRDTYEQQNAAHVYERFKGLPVIYGLHLHRP